MRQFAHQHPSPSSGIPESAVAGALGFSLLDATDILEFGKQEQLWDGSSTSFQRYILKKVL